MYTQVNKGENGAGIGREMSGINSPILKNFRFLSISERSYIGLQAPSRRDSFENSSSGDDFEAISFHSFDSIASAQREQVISFIFLD